MTLYKILRNPFVRTKRLKEWMRINHGELPVIQLLSLVKDRKNGILQEYIREVFQQSKNIYMKERNILMKKNIVVGIGNHDIYQKIDSENKYLMTECETPNISQEDFRNVKQQELDIFIAELCKEKDADILNAKKAVLSVMNAKYADTIEEYTEYLECWKKEKKSFSEKVKSSLQIAAQIAGILSFISKLMGI